MFKLGKNFSDRINNILIRTNFADFDISFFVDLSHDIISTMLEYLMRSWFFCFSNLSIALLFE